MTNNTLDILLERHSFGCALGNITINTSVSGAPKECTCGLVEARAELAKLRDNYKASQELLAIREEQIGEFLSQRKVIRELVARLEEQL